MMPKTRKISEKMSKIIVFSDRKIFVIKIYPFFVLTFLPDLN